MDTTPAIMVIDDDADSREEVASAVYHEGWGHPVESRHGVEAVTAVRKIAPAVILAGIEQPGLRQLQSIKALTAALPGVPVVAFSRTADMSMFRRLMQAGVCDVLRYPIQGADLTAAIEGIATRKAAPAGAETAGVVLTVTGQKGGIGKTTLSTNLAAALAMETHASVLLIDLDTKFGDVALMLDVTPQATAAEMALVAGEIDAADFKAALVKHESGAYILPGPHRPGDWLSVQPEDVERLVRVAASMFDYVVLDTPGTFNDIVLAGIRSASRVLAVTTLDMASIKNTCLLLQVLAEEGVGKDRVHVVLNHTQAATGGVSPIDLHEAIGSPPFHEIPYERDVTLSSQLGRPIVVSRPGSAAAARYRALAQRLTGVAAHTPKPRASMPRPLVGGPAAETRRRHFRIPLLSRR